MIISVLANFMKCNHQPWNCIKRSAPTLDWITAIALLTIGLLGMCHVLPLSQAATWALFGAGLTLTTLLFLTCLPERDLCK